MTKPTQVIFFVSMMLLAGYLKSLAQIQDSTSWKNEVQAVLNQQVEAWNGSDIDGYMEGYWKSDSLLFTSGGNNQRGWKATLAKYKKSYDTPEKMGKLKFSQLEYYPLSPEAAWVFGNWELGRKQDNPKGVFTLVLRKFPDGWKIVHDHTSSSK